MPEKDMVDMVTKQELEAARIDVKHAGEAVNEEKVVKTRLGRSFKSIPLIVKEGEAKITQAAQTITNATASIISQKNQASETISQAESDVVTAATDVHQRGNQEIINLQNAIDIAAAAGAGENGWTASLVVDAGGKNQQQINNEQKQINDGANTIADLLAIQNRQNGMRINAKGYHAPTLFVEANPYKGGGTFVWDAASTATPNGGTVLQKPGVTTGRWIRQLADSEFITPQMFGAKADGVTDDYDAIMAAINSFKGARLSSNVVVGSTVFFPLADYYLRQTLNLKSAVRLLGETSAVANTTRTTFVFPVNSDGIIVNRSSTNGPFGTVPVTDGADGSYVEGIAVTQKGFDRRFARALDFNSESSSIIAETSTAKFSVGDSISTYYSNFDPYLTAIVTSVTAVTHSLAIKNSPTPFIVGEIITGQTSGATATVVFKGGKVQVLSLNNLSTNFALGETVVGQTSGSTAVVSAIKQMGLTVYGLGSMVGEFLDHPETGDVVFIKSDAGGTGMLLRARATLKNVIVNGFGHYGIAVIAGSGVHGNTNANSFSVIDATVWGCNLDGFFTAGSDANAGTVIGLNVISCGGYGVRDRSFLGNHYFSCHVSANIAGAYYSQQLNNFSLFSGCYSEAGTTPTPFRFKTSKFGINTTVIGGDHGAGIASAKDYYAGGYAGMTAGELNIGDSALKVKRDAGGKASVAQFRFGAGTPALRLIHSSNGGVGRGVFVETYLAAWNSGALSDDLREVRYGGKYGITYATSNNGSQFELHLNPVYSSSSTLTLTNGNPTTAAGIAPIITNGVITGATIVSAGEGYITAPTVTGTGLFSTVTGTTEIFDGRVINVTITSSPTGLPSWTPIQVLSVTSNQILPSTDNGMNFGSASNRLSQIYAATGTINTSDEREKQQIRDLSEAEKRVAVKLKSQIKAFKFNDAVIEKGDKARIHFGVIAQEVKAAFESEGLVAEDYAILCYDEWEAEYREITEEITVTNDAGEEVTEIVETGERELTREAGSRYGVRYEELLAFIISAL